VIVFHTKPANTTPPFASENIMEGYRYTLPLKTLAEGSAVN
jgi:hypothetical protein